MVKKSKINLEKVRASLNTSGPLCWCGPVLAPQVVVSSALAVPFRERVSFLEWCPPRWTPKVAERPIEWEVSEGVSLPLS